MKYAIAHKTKETVAYPRLYYELQQTECITVLYVYCIACHSRFEKEVIQPDIRIITENIYWITAMPAYSKVPT